MNTEENQYRPSGIIIDASSRRPNPQAQYAQQQNANDENYIPEAPLIDSIQEEDRLNNPNMSQQYQAAPYRNNYVEPDQQYRTQQEKQEYANRVLGIGKYRKDTVMDLGDEDDSPSGLNR